MEENKAPSFSIFESDYAANNRTTDVFELAFRSVVEGLEKGPGCSDSDIDETSAYANLIRGLARLVTSDDTTWEHDRDWTEADAEDYGQDLTTIGDAEYAERAARLFGGKVEERYSQE